MKQPPVLLKAALLVLACAGIAVWGWRAFGLQRPQAAEGAGGGAEGAGVEESAGPGRRVVVTYFTSDQRCPTCLKIEKLAHDAVHGGFADGLADGSVRFRTVNFDRPENKAFIGRYGLAFKTVVVAEYENGREVRWEKFDKVWDLVGEPGAFEAYLREGIRRHLEPGDDA